MRFQINPFTDQFDITDSGTGGTNIQTITGNVGGPISPDVGANINIIGDNTTGIDVLGFPFINTLTISGIDATTTQKGVLATASNAEAAAQSSTTKALTPSNATSLFSTNPLPPNQGGTGQTTYTDGQLLIGNSTGNTLTKNSLTAGAGITITPGSGSITIAATGVPAPNQLQIFYVGKNGNDANSGLNIENSKLTFGAAITAAGLLTPSAVNRFAISCIDDGIYTENISPPSFVDVFAPNAKLVGNIIASDDSFVKFRAQSVATGDTGVGKFGGTGIFYVEIDEIDCAGTGGWVVSTSGIVNATWKKLVVVDGSGIGDLTSAIGHIHVKGGDLYVNGTGNGIARANTGSTVGHIDHIIDIGGGNGTGIAINDGEFDLSVQSFQGLANSIFVSGGQANIIVNNINSTSAYGVTGGTLTLFYNTLTGTRSNVGGTVKTWCTITEGTAGQIAQSAGANASPVFSTATYPSTTAQGDLLSSTSANTIVALAKDTNATRYLANTGVNNNAQWDQVNLANGVTGTLLPANGGTGVSSPTAHSLLVAEGASAFTALGVATNGFIPIGSTGADPVLAAITAGANTSVTNGAGSITIASTGNMTWTEETGASFNIAINNGYITNRATLVTATLPSTAAQGSLMRIVNIGAGGVKIAQNAGQTIRRGTNSSTTGATGFIQSINQYTSVSLLCTVANNDFQVIDGDGGNWTIS